MVAVTVGFEPITVPRAVARCRELQQNFLDSSHIYTRLNTPRCTQSVTAALLRDA